MSYSKSTSSTSTSTSTIFKNTLMKLYKNGLQIIPSKNSKSKVSVYTLTKPIYWNTSRNCWFTSIDNTDYLLDKGSKWSSPCPPPSPSPKQVEKVQMYFKNTYLKLYKEGLKVVPSKDYAYEFESDMGVEKPIYWNTTSNCWFTSIDNTDYLLDKGSKWSSPSPSPSPKEVEKGKMYFKDTYLKLYKEGLKVVPSKDYAYEFESDMGVEKPIYWNTTSNCWFTSKDNTDYLLEQGSKWFSSASSPSPKEVEKGKMYFKDTYLKLYKEGLKVVPSDDYAYEFESDMGVKKPIYWNTTSNCWFTSKDNTDYLLEQGSKWFSTAS
uniref:Uncharacterized protein n=1 Tax=viral metagenome TaxID=1070528 RepID=A0A6C0EI02_9ZZZZ